MNTNQLKLLVPVVMATSFSLNALAEEAPRSHVASPDIYKVLAENDQMRVILATWKPGQKDKMHSHPMKAGYSLTDCSFRIYKGDGTTVDKTKKARVGARIAPPVKKHAFQNTGKTTCEILLVEYKN